MWQGIPLGRLWVLPMEGDRKPRVFLQTPFQETAPRVSPDGRWVAYSSDESGRLEVYVRPSLCCSDIAGVINQDTAELLCHDSKKMRLIRIAKEHSNLAVPQAIFWLGQKRDFFKQLLKK